MNEADYRGLARRKEDLRRAWRRMRIGDMDPQQRCPTVQPGGQPSRVAETPGIEHDELLGILPARLRYWARPQTIGVFDDEREPHGISFGWRMERIRC